MKKNLKLIDRHLQSRGLFEPYAVDYFNRLNVAGLDYKGQLSTAYGQSGYGMSIGLAFDFGAMLCPGVHLVPSAALKGSRVAHTLLVLSRLPEKIWLRYQLQPPQHAKVGGGRPRQMPYPRADWASTRSIGFGYMRGRTLDFSIDISAAAWVGFGNVFDTDETGVGGGVKLSAGAKGRFTRLRDPAPSHHVAGQSSDLKGAVESLFVDSLRRKAAAWLMQVGKGPQAAIACDTPVEPASQVLSRLELAGMTIEKAGIDAANLWDTHDTALINRSGGGIAGTLARRIGAIGGWISNKWKDHSIDKLDVDELIDKLLEARKLYDDYIVAEELQYRKRRAIEKNLLGKRLADLSADLLRGNASLGVADDAADSAPMLQLAASRIKASRMRISECDELVSVLRRTRDFRPQKRNDPSGTPAFALDLVMIEGRAEAQVGVQLVLPKLARGSSSGARLVPVGHASLKAGAQGHAKRIGFRVESFVPGAGPHDRVLRCTQETVVTYRSSLWTWDVGVGVGASNPGSKQSNLITMSYRAVNACWFDDDQPNGRAALPNGSGISFGMSILMTRVRAYAAACRAQGSDNFARPLPDDIAPLEDTMLDQLRLTRPILRSCFRALPEWLADGLDIEDAFVLESSIALVVPHKLDMKEGRPVDLFKLPAFAALADSRGQPDKRYARHQVIRLRYRIRSDEDRSRNVFNFGWNPLAYIRTDSADGIAKAQLSASPFESQNNYDEDLRRFEQFQSFGSWSVGDLECPDLAAQVSAGLERVQRVGSEGLVTVYRHHVVPPYDANFYGQARASDLEARHARRNSEFLVPPVMLFSQ